MGKYTWTNRQLRILKKEYPSIDDPRNLVRRVGKPYTAIKSKATVLGLHRKRHAGSPWTPAKEQKLIRLYPNISNAAIGKRLGMTESQVSSRAFKLHLFKTAAFKYKAASKGMFRKGQVPANKGRKQTSYMSTAAIERTKATRFRKGNLPHNAVGFKDGDITIRNDHPERNGGRTYKYIRLSLSKWYPLHQHIWEQKNGRLPKGYCLWFRDGDSLNCKLDNLELITRAENMRRNSCSRRVTDGYVANILAREKGGVGLIDRELQKIILQDKKLIELKRQQLLLQRTIKKHTDGKK